MPILNRSLEVATCLVGSYRKLRHVCTVAAGEDGKTAYVLEDGRRFRSPSAAASALMDGKAVNGWRFWSLESDGQRSKQPASRSEKTRKLISRVANQQGVEDGKTRYWCSACMRSFIAEAGEIPEACPDGHTADVSGAIFGESGTSD